MISRCSSPMPAMMVWPVSSSVRTRKVGSSSASFIRLSPSRSWSTLVLGSMATEMTGSGNSMDSRTIGLPSSQRVSPVVVTLEAHSGGDVAGEDLGDVLAVVGVHLQDAPDPLLLVLARVVARTSPP